MNPAVWGFIGVLLGSIIGASASILTSIINTRNESKLQSKRERYQREERLKEFQRRNLLRLQDLLPHCMFLMNRAHIVDVNNAKNQKKWREVLLSADLDGKIRISFRKLTIIIDRVSNEKLRKDLMVTHKYMGDYLFAKSEIEAECLLKKYTNNFSRLMAKVGIELRSTYNV